MRGGLNGQIMYIRCALASPGVKRTIGPPGEGQMIAGSYCNELTRFIKFPSMPITLFERAQGRIVMVDELLKDISSGNWRKLSAVWTLGQNTGVNIDDWDPWWTQYISMWSAIWESCAN